MGKRLTLVLGGARSGKSTYAEQQAALLSGRVLYAATAEALDEEMEKRIAVHRSQRPGSWRTIESPRDVAGAIRPHLDWAGVVLLDCLTLLAANLFSDPETADKEPDGDYIEGLLRAEVDGLLALYQASDAHWIIVSNEVGLGVVPPYRTGRIFRDVLGRANQQLAAAADQVVFMISGLPMMLKV